MEAERKQKDHFTAIDHLIVKMAVKRLPTLLSNIMALRFWHNYSVIEIADEIGIPTKVVEDGIAHAFRLLRQECLMSPAFSRSLYAEVQAARLRSAA